MKEMFMKKVNPATDLELYEIMLAAYPDTFDEESDDNIWDEVMQFSEDMFGDIEMLKEFLGRLVLLTSPLKSPLTGNISHCLGKVEIIDDRATMFAGLKRPASDCY